jgi:hypothetical protein
MMCALLTPNPFPGVVALGERVADAFDAALPPGEAITTASGTVIVAADVTGVVVPAVTALTGEPYIARCALNVTLTMAGAPTLLQLVTTCLHPSAPMSAAMVGRGGLRP